MSITVNSAGVLHELATITVNSAGVLHELLTVHCNNNGVLREIYHAQKIPETLNWFIDTGSVGAVLSTSNNGYTCTITRTTTSSNSQHFDFTASRPTRFTITPIDTIVQGYGLDNSYTTHRTTSSFVIDSPIGNHSIKIQTESNPAKFAISAIII